MSNEGYRNNNGFDADSTLPCTKCGKVDVHVGFGGQKNLEIHQTSKGCVVQVRKNAKPKAKFKSLRTFFASKAEKNLPTVSNPPMVHTTPIPGSSTGVALLAPSAPPIPPKKGCLLALELLDKLENNARRIPETLLVAKDES